MLTFNSLAIGAASLFVLVAADHGHDLHARSHHHGVVDRSVHTLQKRFSGQATYYITGLGACGHYNNPSDHIVALNSAQFGTGYPGPNCQKYITICAFGKCVGAQITDECPTCDHGSLDLSEGLFQQFASTDKGVFQMTWTFNDDTPKPTGTKKAETPKTTKQPETTKEPEPTTTWEPPTTTSTKKKTTTSSPPPETTSTPEPTTSKTSSTPEPTSTSEAKSSTSIAPTTISSSAVPSASASAAPTSSPVAGSGSSSGSGGSNLADANQIMLALGKLAVVANGGQ